MRKWLVLSILLCGCGIDPAKPPLTREQQIAAYKTCEDAGKVAKPIRDGITNQIMDVECEP
jgi:hypothetical protein